MTRGWFATRKRARLLVTELLVLVLGVDLASYLFDSEGAVEWKVLRRVSTVAMCGEMRCTARDGTVRGTREWRRGSVEEGLVGLTFRCWPQRMLSLGLATRVKTMTAGVHSSCKYILPTAYPRRYHLSPCS